MNADRTVTAGAMRARTGDMLPGRASDPGGTAADSRRFMEAVPWRFRTGSPWRDLPERSGNRDGASRRFRRRPLPGVFARGSDALSEESGLERVSGGGTAVRAVAGADRLHEDLAERGAAAAVPSRRSRTAPRAHGRDVCGWRRLAESLFAKAREFRAVAARCARTGGSFAAGIASSPAWWPRHDCQRALT